LRGTSARQALKCLPRVRRFGVNCVRKHFAQRRPVRCVRACNDVLSARSPHRVSSDTRYGTVRSCLRPTRSLPYASTDGECVVVGSGRCTIARIFGSHYCRCSCLSLRIALRKTDSVQKLRHCNNDALIGKAANVADSVARSTCYPREEQNRERGKSFALSLARVPPY